MEIAPGVYSMGQEEGGRVHAYLLDDGNGLTLLDTTVPRRREDRAGRNSANRQDAGAAEAHHPDARAQVPSRWPGRPQEGQRRDRLRARLGGGHHRRTPQGDASQPDPAAAPAGLQIELGLALGLGRIRRAKSIIV